MAVKHLLLALLYPVGLIVSGCSHTNTLTEEHPANTGTDVSYSVIFYIHADADYLFHTPDGTAVYHNSGVLATAFDVAESAISGEVFIIHQRPEKKRLGLFPRRSQRLFHYRNGKLVHQVHYRHPDKREAFLATEARFTALYRTRNRTENHQSYLLYFGHEIPSENGEGYHRSLPGIDVNTASFAHGVQNFLISREDRFDLIVLSTCNGGTPAMAEHLIGVTSALLASPQNLHLSHMDSSGLTLLETELSPLQLGRSMAGQTYQRLEATVQTPVTLALYDFREVRTYIHNLSALTASEEAPDQSMQLQNHVDCASMSFPEFGTFLGGVETWYKPARFGRPSGRLDHSGWGCNPQIKK